MSEPLDTVTARVAAATRPRLGSDVNEDGVGSIAGAAWVLDGAGVSAGTRSCCGKDATWLVTHLDASLRHLLTETPELDLVTAVAEAIARARDEHALTCTDTQRREGPSSTVAIARPGRHHLDVLVLGDSVALIDLGGPVLRLRDSRLQTVAPDLRERLRRGNASARAPLIDAERQARNRPGGYWIAADQPMAAQEAIVRRLPRDGSSPWCAALLSDGAYRAVEPFGIFRDDRQALDGIRTRGLDACIAEIRRAERADHERLIHPRSSVSDDASIALLQDTVERGPYRTA